MPLRTPNNPNTPTTVMTVLSQVMLNDASTGQPNTQIGLNQAVLNASLVYIEQKYAMAQGSFPAIHLSRGKQTYHIIGGPRGYDGVVEIMCEYYDRWDQQNNTIDTINANNIADLDRIQANLETNNSLNFQGKATAIAIPEIAVGPYKGELDITFPGLTLVYHWMSITVNVLPYDG